MPNEEACMRLILAALAAVAVAAGIVIQGAGPAQAECSLLSRHPCVPAYAACSATIRARQRSASVLRHGPCVPEIQYPLGQICG